MGWCHKNVFDLYIFLFRRLTKMCICYFIKIYLLTLTAVNTLKSSLVKYLRTVTFNFPILVLSSKFRNKIKTLYHV